MSVTLYILLCGCVHLLCSKKVYELENETKFKMGFFIAFLALAECISLYKELPQILLSSGWICSLVHILTAVKGVSYVYIFM